MNQVDIGHAALLEARRIVVIGCSGAGKSTFSRILAHARGIPHLSMDREFFWLPGWKLRERSEIRRMIGEAVMADAWIMDGNSARTLDLRLQRADLVIWFRLPRLLCLWRVLKRWVTNLGRTRPEMADGCPEKIDMEFLRYIWHFEEHEGPQIERAIADHGRHVPILTLNSRAEVEALLARLPNPV